MATLNSRVEKEWEYKGYKCQVRIHKILGVRCGYVGIDETHKLYGKDYNELDNIRVHGGITFSDRYDGSNLWWFGYDCGHGGDGQDINLVDAKYKQHFIRFNDDPVRSLEYCIQECETLADQLSEVE